MKPSSQKLSRSGVVPVTATEVPDGEAVPVRQATGAPAVSGATHHRCSGTSIYPGSWDSACNHWITLTDNGPPIQRLHGQMRPRGPSLRLYL
jgi:hypothetical protein